VAGSTLAGFLWELRLTVDSRSPHRWGVRLPETSASNRRTTWRLFAALCLASLGIEAFAIAFNRWIDLWYLLLVTGGFFLAHPWAVLCVAKAYSRRTKAVGLLFVGLLALQWIVMIVGILGEIHHLPGITSPARL
jgi:hypothetical protein